MSCGRDAVWSLGLHTYFTALHESALALSVGASMSYRGEYWRVSGLQWARASLATRRDMNQLILVHASKEPVVEQWDHDDCDVRCPI